MTNVIVFRKLDGDDFFRVKVDYDFSIGDVVYYDLTREEIDRIDNFYPHLDCEGMIVEKWINLREKHVLWYVDIDFVPVNEK